MLNLVDIAVHYTYQTDHGLQTSIAPAMLVPACANCFAACPQDSFACGSCRRYICGKCEENHVLFDDLQNPIIYCSTCAGQQDSNSSASSEWTDSSESFALLPARSASGGSLRSGDSTYCFLRKVWQHMATTRLKDGYWVAMARLEGFIAAPAKDVGMWMVLSLRLASRYPRGITVFDLDGQKCIVCAPGQAPAQADVNSALSWIRKMGDATIGIAVYGSSFACLSVHRDRKAGCIQEHRNVLINAASGFSFVEF